MHSHALPQQRISIIIILHKKYWDRYPTELDRNIQLDRPVCTARWWYTHHLQPTQGHAKWEQAVSGESGRAT